MPRRVWSRSVDFVAMATSDIRSSSWRSPIFPPVCIHLGGESLQDHCHIRRARLGMRRGRKDKQPQDEWTIAHRRLPRSEQTSADGFTAQRLEARERGACSSNVLGQQDGQAWRVLRQPRPPRRSMASILLWRRLCLRLAQRRFQAAAPGAKRAFRTSAASGAGVLRDRNNLKLLTGCTDYIPNSFAHQQPGHWGWVAPVSATSRYFSSGEKAMPFGRTISVITAATAPDLASTR